jgi:hypothetical protein
MLSQYAIGTSYPPTNLELLTTPVPPPMQSFPKLYSVTFDRGDGSVAGHGFPVSPWVFQVLQQAEVDMLATFWTVSGVLVKSRTLYIRTRKPQKHSEFEYYQAIGIWPELDEFRQIGGHYVNVPIVWRRLEVYTP